MKKVSLNPFDKIPARCEGVVSVYADYKHFNELFRDEDIPAYGNLLELSGSISNGGWIDLSGGNGPEVYNEGSRSVQSSAHDQLHPKTHKTDKFDKKNYQKEDNHNPSEDDMKATLISLFSSDKLTLWLSSHGAHTPLHYDTYGCNLVVQLSGRKRWRLWPPSSQSDPTLLPPQKSPISQACTAPQHLKLTCSRIPYEESSIYSTYDPRSNDPQNNIVPSYDFMIEEGDILFIPKHYWHFVETDSELSLSLNLWLPVPLPLPSTEQLHCGIYQNDQRSKSAGRGHVDGGKNDNGETFVEGLQINGKEGDEDRNGIEIIEDDQKLKPVVKDTYSRLAEAATRMVFGALKGSVSRCFETDDIR